MLYIIVDHYFRPKFYHIPVTIEAFSSQPPRRQFPTDSIKMLTEILGICPKFQILLMFL